MQLKNSVTFLLDKKSVKPVFELKVNDKSITCLHDSGASISAWVANRHLFEDVFSNAKELRETCQLHGFGGEGGLGLPAFEIPIFKLGPVTFTRMVVIADYDRKFNCDLVLGANLFKYAKVVIDRLNFNDLNRPPNITYQFDRSIYNIKTYKSEGIITQSAILNQEMCKKL